ncbi:hypothetical protein K502DRAFT_345083 [Neoconidiobolus thromboides FSU 785]|nr:hypothetical protein K502DRAFT_345083 [Neoconidiobolus thromboides FSU 785]
MDLINVEDQLSDLISDCATTFEKPETAENWSKYEIKMKKLKTQLLANEDYLQCNNFQTLFSKIHTPIMKSVSTDRTRLSLATQELVSVLALGLKQDFQPYVINFITTLIKVLGKNRLLREKAYKTLSDIVESYPYRGMLQEFQKGLKDSNIYVRETCIILIDSFIYNWELDSTMNFFDTIEKCLSQGLSDKDINVRNVVKHTYQLYTYRCPERQKKIDGYLSEAILKNIQKYPYPTLARKLNREVQVFEKQKEDSEVLNRSLLEKSTDPIKESQISSQSNKQQESSNPRKTIIQYPMANYSLVKSKISSFHNKEVVQFQCKGERLIKINEKSDNLQDKKQITKLPSRSNSALSTTKLVKRTFTGISNPRVSSVDSKPNLKRSHETMKQKSSVTLITSSQTKPAKRIISHPIPDYSWVKPKVQTFRTREETEKLNSSSLSLKTRSSSISSIKAPTPIIKLQKKRSVQSISKPDNNGKHGVESNGNSSQKQANFNKNGSVNHSEPSEESISRECKRTKSE